MKPIIVGEGPSPSFVGHPKLRPLFGNPTRVLCDAMGLEVSCTGHRADLLRYVKFGRLASLESLCKGKWDLREAESKATVLCFGASGRTFILLGKRVARAFGFRDLPFFQQKVHWSHNLVVLPHPSGLNRLWNDEETRRKAGDVLKKFLTSFEN